jgi:hypothetical protein
LRAILLTAIGIRCRFQQSQLLDASRDNVSLVFSLLESFHENTRKFSLENDVFDNVEMLLGVCLLRVVGIRMANHQDDRLLPASPSPTQAEWDLRKRVATSTSFTLSFFY